MATVKVPLDIGAALFPTSNPAAPTLFQGTNFPVQGLAFDATTQETAFWIFRAASYGSGNLTFSLYWYADTASSGGVVFEVAIAAITPDTDSQDVETKAFATAQQNSDTHLGTTGQRVHQMSITISNLDSIAADDYVALRLRRVPADGSDTMTGDAIVADIQVSYSDT
jgi:hypothetical protein